MTARAFTLLAVLALLLLAPCRGVAQDFGMQLEEILRLIEEKSYTLALEDLRFAARQVQELRLREVAPLFPEPPSGWTAAEPLLIMPEEETWSRRLQVLSTYRPADGPGKVEVLYDFFSPLIPQASLSLNPVYAAGDPRTQILEISGEKARILYNDDTGEGEILMIPGNRLLLSIVGRGLSSREVLRDFAGRIEMTGLKTFTPP